MLKPSINARRKAPCTKFLAKTLKPPLIASTPAERPPAIIEFQISSLRRTAAKTQSHAEYSRPQMAKLPTSHEHSPHHFVPPRAGALVFTAYTIPWSFAPLGEFLMPRNVCQIAPPIAPTPSPQENCLLPIIKAPPVSSISL